MIEQNNSGSQNGTDATPIEGTGIQPKVTPDEMRKTLTSNGASIEFTDKFVDRLYSKADCGRHFLQDYCDCGKPDSPGQPKAETHTNYMQVVPNSMGCVNGHKATHQRIQGNMYLCSEPSCDYYWIGNEVRGIPEQENFRGEGTPTAIPSPGVDKGSEEVFVDGWIAALRDVEGWIERNHLGKGHDGDDRWEHCAAEILDWLKSQHDRGMAALSPQDEPRSAEGDDAIQTQTIEQIIPDDLFDKGFSIRDAKAQIQTLVTQALISQLEAIQPAVDNAAQNKGLVADTQIYSLQVAIRDNLTELKKKL